MSFRKIEEGKSIQILHLGSYDDEPKSFEQMNEFARKRDLTRIGDFHKEIYLSNKNRTSEEKQKNIFKIFSEIGGIYYAKTNEKNDLMTTAKENYEKLNLLISKMTEEELNTPFDFSKDEKKKEAHWRRDKNLRDVLIHLYEWHQLILNWVHSNQKGEEKPFLPEPYNWKTYGDMNVEFWKKHQNTSLEDATDMFHKSHVDVLALAEKFTSEELFSKGVYKWTVGSTLGSYFVSTTSSRYDWAMKKLKAHQKNCKSK